MVNKGLISQRLINQERDLDVGGNLGVRLTGDNWTSGNSQDFSRKDVLSMKENKPMTNLWETLKSKGLWKEKE